MRHALMLILLAIASISIVNTACAVDMVRKVDLEIHGQTYTFPVGSKEREMDTFWLKKAADGDKQALEMFLGGLDERLFFVGDDSPAWLRVTSDGKMEVV